MNEACATCDDTACKEGSIALALFFIFPTNLPSESPNKNTAARLYIVNADSHLDKSTALPNNKPEVYGQQESG